MTTVILRPTGTITGGSPAVSYTGASLHGTLGDNTDTTVAQPNALSSAGSFYGDAAFDATFGVVSFADATGTIPAGKTITSVDFNARMHYDNASNGCYGAVSFRYSDDIEAVEIGSTPGNVPSTGVGTTTSTVSRGTATAWSGSGSNKGVWTLALIDGIKAGIAVDATGGATPPSSIYDIWLVVTYFDAPGTPTAVTPAAASTVTTPSPALGATLPAIATGQTQRAEWQFATDSGFTTGIQTVTEQTIDLRASGATTESPNMSILSLSNGTWYVRARIIDQYGTYGAYSAGQSFTVNTPLPPVPTQVAVQPYVATITASSEYPAIGQAVNILDGSLGTVWQTNGTVAGWLRAQLAAATIVTSYTMIARLSSPLRNPKTWTWEGSNNGSTWTVLDTRTNITWVTTPTTPQTFTYANSTAYLYYRINITANSGDATYTSFISLDFLDVPTVATQTPILKGTVGTASGGRLSKMEYQFATNSGFTANVRTITESGADERVTGCTIEPVPLASKLTINGTWYLRARSVANDSSTSAYTTTQTITLALAAPTYPSTIVPTTGSTVTRNDPYLSATILPAPEGRLSLPVWQLATNTGFTVNLKTVNQPAGTTGIISGVSGRYVDSANLLYQTTWYIRAAAIDENGLQSAWSGYNSFVVAHQPNTNSQSPTADVTVGYGATNTFSWVFTDPSSSDSQRARQIIIERNDTGASVLDTGKVVTTAQTANLAVGAGMKDIKLRWKIRVWDQDDVASVYSPYNLFTVTDPVVVTITSPLDTAVVTTGRPTITWTNDVATVQVKYQVLFQTPGNVTIHDSGLITGTALSYTPPTNILSNASSYKVTVTVTDNVMLVGFSTNNFTTLYVAPADVTYSADVSGYASLGYVLIDWSQTQPDAFFSTWRIYRREINDVNWTLLLETQQVNLTQLKDWQALSNYTYQYAVTQIATRSGVLVESTANSLATWNQLISGDYWLINPSNDATNFLLYHVTDDSYVNEMEQESYVVINRGRRTNYGTIIGKAGSLTAQLRDHVGNSARQQKIALEAMQEARVSYLLRDPFGSIMQVSIGNVGISRIAGVGTSEFCNVTIPYSEVF